MFIIEISLYLKERLQNKKYICVRLGMGMVREQKIKFFVNPNCICNLGFNLILSYFKEAVLINGRLIEKTLPNIQTENQINFQFSIESGNIFKV